MNAQERLWRTADGDLVRDGDPAAGILAYAAGDEIASADQAKVPGAETEAGGSQKARPASANKAGKPQGNKAGS